MCNNFTLSFCAVFNAVEKILLLSVLDSSFFLPKALLFMLLLIAFYEILGAVFYVGMHFEIALDNITVSDAFDYFLVVGK